MHPPALPQAWGLPRASSAFGQFTVSFLYLCMDDYYEKTADAASRPILLFQQGSACRQYLGGWDYQTVTEYSLMTNTISVGALTMVKQRSRL